MTARDGGAAFPFSPPVDDTGRSAVGYPFPELGMTLRDWFAGQALACVYRRFECGSDPMTEDLAFQAYAIADAMIAERKGDLE